MVPSLEGVNFSSLQSGVAVESQKALAKGSKWVFSFVSYFVYLLSNSRYQGLSACLLYDPAIKHFPFVSDDFLKYLSPQRMAVLAVKVVVCTFRFTTLPKLFIMDNNGTITVSFEHLIFL